MAEGSWGGWVRGRGRGGVRGSTQILDTPTKILNTTTTPQHHNTTTPQHHNTRKQKRTQRTQHTHNTHNTQHTTHNTTHTQHTHNTHTTHTHTQHAQHTNTTHKHNTHTHTHNTNWPKMDWPKMTLAQNGQNTKHQFWPKMDWPKLDWPKLDYPKSAMTLPTPHHPHHTMPPFLPPQPPPHTNRGNFGSRSSLVHFVCSPRQDEATCLAEAGKQSKSRLAGSKLSGVDVRSRRVGPRQSRKGPARPKPDRGAGRQPRRHPPVPSGGHERRTPEEAW